MASFERILVAIDGSENSLRAAQWAVDIAKKEGSSLFVLNVIPAPHLTMVVESGSANSAMKEFFDKARSDAEGIVQKVVSQAQSEGIKVRGEIVENVPSVVESITDYADEWKIQVIVVGTRGLSGFKKLLLGSVSGALVAHAPCSVLVVR